jgi:hypothetical protein
MKLKRLFNELKNRRIENYKDKKKEMMKKEKEKLNGINSNMINSEMKFIFLLENSGKKKI